MQAPNGTAGPAAIDSEATADALAGSLDRVWLERLPLAFVCRVKRPYTDAEIIAAARLCNTSAPAPARPPKLIFQLGAPGTGKSTRLVDSCRTMFGIDDPASSVVVADGDNIRESHTGLREALGLTKRLLLDGMGGPDAAELRQQYIDQLAPFPDSQRVGFADSVEWVYNDSSVYKERFANNALAAAKDVVMGVTKRQQLTEKYKTVVDNAVNAGYEICGMVTLVEPAVLVRRQEARAQSTGRMTKTHRDCTDGSSLTNARLQQAMIVDAVPALLELVQQHAGTMAIYDNSPDLPVSLAALYTWQAGGQTTTTYMYPGEASEAGLMAFLR